MQKLGSELVKDNIDLDNGIYMLVNQKANQCKKLHLTIIYVYK